MAQLSSGTWHGPSGTTHAIAGRLCLAEKWGADCVSRLEAERAENGGTIASGAMLRQMDCLAAFMKEIHRSSAAATASNY
jgi:hypothetical protein